MENKIVTIENKRDEKSLRQKTKEVTLSMFTRKDLDALIARMKKSMRLAKGIGLSANQIGLDMRLFVAEVPATQGELKFYALFNPKIEKTSQEKGALEEGCLSVPGTYGEVERPSRITVSGTDKTGKAVKIKAWGLLARVFQHEIDHLNGKLFIDKAKTIHKITNRMKNEK